MDVYIKKGDYLEATWFAADPIGSASLAGVQLKATGTFRSIKGIVNHIRGFDGNFKKFTFFVHTEDNQGTPCSKCGVNEVEVEPRWVTKVTPSEELCSSP